MLSASAVIAGLTDCRVSAVERKVNTV